MGTGLKPRENISKRLARLLRRAIPRLRESLALDLDNATVFLMPQDTSDKGSGVKIESVFQELATQFEVEVRRFSSEAPLFAGWLEIPPEFCVTGFFVKNVGGQLVRDAFESFFRRHGEHTPESPSRVRLVDHGLLLPRTCEIKCFSFAHGLGHYYRYRLAMHKLSRIPGSLHKFLFELPRSCPNHFFMTGPRASSFDAKIAVEPVRMKEHPCISSAKEALACRTFKSAHEDVEKYMLENDPESIATEVPIWLDPGEMKRFGWAHEDSGCLTGHIDVLRYENDGMLGIWDFKPDAAYESDAKVQVFLYALMLSLRTGIALSSFRCGYFDSEDAFVFAAGEVDI